MADLKREEELAYVLVSIVRDMAGRRVEDCIPELAMWIKTVREEVRDEERSARPAKLRSCKKHTDCLTADEVAPPEYALHSPPYVGWDGPGDEERSAPPEPIPMECGRCLASGEHVPASECERHFGERHG